jgi:hypothetical protein
MNCSPAALHQKNSPQKERTAILDKVVVFVSSLNLFEIDCQQFCQQSTIFCHLAKIAGLENPAIISFIWWAV